jgi:hypothetical protein
MHQSTYVVGEATEDYTRVKDEPYLHTFLHVLKSLLAFYSTVEHCLKRKEKRFIV